MARNPQAMRIDLTIISALSALAITGFATAPPSSPQQAQPAAAEGNESPAELTAALCLICHGNFVPGQGPLAPPFVMVKSHYGSLDEETFIKTVVSWVKEPDKQKSRMPGAINRFGIMPPLGYPDAQVETIARHIYQSDFPMRGRGGNQSMRGQAAADCEPGTTAAALIPNEGCGEECGPAGDATTTPTEPIEKSAASVQKKWPIPVAMMAHLQNLEEDIAAFGSIVSADHANFAARNDNHLTELITSCTMEGDGHTALHEWLVPFRELVKQHAQAVEPAVQQDKIAEMRRFFKIFHEQFEAAPRL